MSCRPGQDVEEPDGYDLDFLGERIDVPVVPGASDARMPLSNTDDIRW